MIATNVESRVSLALAVREYLRQSDRHDEALKGFEGACDNLRSQIDRNARYVVQIDYRHWLLEVDEQGTAT